MRRSCLNDLSVNAFPALPLFAENMWQSHGNNYSYYSCSSPEEEKVIFPVVGGIRSTGSTSVSYSVSSQEAAELSLYNLAVRKVIALWGGNGNGLQSAIDIVMGVFPTGLYFVTLTGENTILTGKCLLW